MDILFFQTADAFRYEPMLRATSRSVIEFCRRSSCAYESFTGVKRGVWPWQATFNRIVQYDELLQRGFRGWAVYLDADAYVVDLDFDIRRYLGDKAGHPAILTPSMSTGHRWDVNAGVCFINMGHPDGQRIIRQWSQRFQAISDARLRQAEVWMEADNDQDLLQCLLRDDAALLASIYLQSTDLMNSSFATFIRQHLRGYTPDFSARVRLIRESVDAIVGAPPVPTLDDGPAAYRRVPDAIARDVIAAIYEALLGRTPDANAERQSLAGMQTQGLGAGLRSLASEVAASEEFRSRPARG